MASKERIWIIKSIWDLDTGRAGLRMLINYLLKTACPEMGYVHLFKSLNMKFQVTELWS